MKRRPSEFYGEFYELRSGYGDKEYGRDDILPAAKALLKKYLLTEDELLTDAAIEILDRADKSDDRAAEGLFPYDLHIALGGKRRISRGAMNLNQHWRRKVIIDANKIAQDVAWANETNGSTSASTLSKIIRTIPSDALLLTSLDAGLPRLHNDRAAASPRYRCRS